MKLNGNSINTRISYFKSYRYWVYNVIMLTLFISIGEISYPEDNKDLLERNFKKIDANNRIFVNDLGMEFILIEGGTFLMGPYRVFGHGNNVLENSSFSVQVTSYFLQTTEITQEQWTLVMGANPSLNIGDNRPVENVTICEIRSFLAKLNSIASNDTIWYRLPTEAEWEYAARGGRNSLNYIYSGSDDFREVGWFKEDGREQLTGKRFSTRNVKGKKPNELLLYDMSGNVSEICDGLFLDYPGTNVLIALDIGETADPLIVVRGGSIFQSGLLVSVRDRDFLTYCGKSFCTGFRIAGSPKKRNFMESDVTNK